MTIQADNMEAVNRYIMTTPVQRPEADRVRTDFIRYWVELGFYEKHFDQASYDLTRNFRNAFNRANAVTPAEQAAVVEQLTRGISSEEMEGETDRRTSTGDYIPAAPSPPISLGLGGSSGNVLLLGVALGLGLVVLLRR